MTESTSEYKKRIEEIKQSIENEPYMAKMREDIAEGISKTGIRQATVEEQFQAVIDETTGKDVISAPEIIVGRGGYATLGERLDSDKAEVTAQLAQKASKAELGYANTEIFGLDKRIDNLVIPVSVENTNIEVTDSHVSVPKCKTFNSLTDRFTETERDVFSIRDNLNDIHTGIGVLPTNKNKGEGTSSPTILAAKGQTSTTPSCAVVNDIHTPMSEKLEYVHRVQRTSEATGTNFLTNPLPEFSEKPSKISLGYWINDDNVNVVFDAGRQMEYWLHSSSGYVSLSFSLKDAISFVGKRTKPTTSINSTGMISSFNAEVECLGKELGYSYISIQISNILWKQEFDSLGSINLYHIYTHVANHLINTPLYYTNVTLLYDDTIKLPHSIHPDNTTVEQYPPAESFQKQIEIINTNMGISSTDVLNGKKIAVAGDSLTEGINPLGGHYKNYGELIAERNNMTYYNYGISGGTLSNVAGHAPFTGRWNTMADDLDYILLWFGWNDSAYSTVGTIDDTVDTTFYGAYNVILPQLIAKYPLAKIGLVVTYGAKAAIKQATRDIGVKYGIPCLDLNAPNTPLIWLRDDVDVAVATQRQTLFTYDTTHPNQVGYNYMSTFFESFIRSL